MRARLVPLLCVIAALAACQRSPSGEVGAERSGARAAARAAAAEGQRLLEITETYYDAWLALNPLEATAQGDDRFDDRFGDYASEMWMADWLAVEQEALANLTFIDAGKLAGDDLVTYEAFRFGRELAVAGFRYPSELLPVRQFASPHLEFAVLGSGEGSHPFRTAADYDNFLRRMDGYVAWVDRVIANMRTGAAREIVLPRVVVERTLPQLAALASADPEQSAFWSPIRHFPAGVSSADRERLRKAYAEKLATQVLPAYGRLHEFLEQEYLPLARKTVAWSELPNGVEWYAYLVRLHTTTTLTAEQIHQLGLDEVARIRAEMERIRQHVGHSGDLRSFFDALRADPEQYYADPEELLAGYRTLQARVDAAMPLLFERRPPSAIEIRAVETDRASMMAAGSHVFLGAARAGPAILYVDTGDLASHPKYAMEARYLHEAVPGRHYQATLARQATGLPRFRRHASDTVYGAGWALYAESLGPDLGLYADPYGRLGTLVSEMLRAVRLVVDTGLHAKGWTRQQAIEYFRANTTLGKSVIEAEVDRQIAWPGHALADKIGQLAILDLRRRAQARLGPRFDIRAFHAQVLHGGSLPLPVLEAKIERWIAAQL